MTQQTCDIHFNEVLFHWTNVKESFYEYFLIVYALLFYQEHFYSNERQHDLKQITFFTLTFKSSTDLDNIAHDFPTVNKPYFN